MDSIPPMEKIPGTCTLFVKPCCILHVHVYSLFTKQSNYMYIVFFSISHFSFSLALPSLSHTLSTSLCLCLSVCFSLSLSLSLSLTLSYPLSSPLLHVRIHFTISAHNHISIDGIGYKPVTAMCRRYQEHLSEAATIVGMEQVNTCMSYKHGQL